MYLSPVLLCCKEENTLINLFSFFYIKNNNCKFSNFPFSSTQVEREPTNYTSFTTTSKNYFKNVSENKEVAKLVSLLSTSINSTKKVRTSVFEKVYNK